MRVWIGDLGSINCTDDAYRAVQQWLDQYCKEHGGEHIIEEVDVKREDDGWYAVMARPPALVVTITKTPDRLT